MKKSDKGRHIVLSEQKEVAKLEAPKPKPMSAGEFLNAVKGVATEEPKKTKKNGIATLTPTESIMKAVDAIVHWKKVAKEAKAELETKEGEVIGFVQEKQDEDAYHNNFQKSYYVKGEKEQVTFVSADKFSAVKTEDLPELKATLGDRFPEFVTEKIEFSVKSEVIENPDTLTEFRTLVGDDKFFKFFEPKVKYIAVEGFDRKRYTLPKETLEKVKELVPQAKPSIR